MKKQRVWAFFEASQNESISLKKPILFSHIWRAGRVFNSTCRAPVLSQPARRAPGAWLIPGQHQPGSQAACCPKPGWHPSCSSPARCYCSLPTLGPTSSPSAGRDPMPWHTPGLSEKHSSHLLQQATGLEPGLTWARCILLCHSNWSAFK